MKLGTATDISLKGTAATAAMLMALAGQVPTSTMHSAENSFTHALIRLSPASNRRYVADLNGVILLQNDRTSQEFASIVIAERDFALPISDSEKSLGELRQWKQLLENWDGEGAAKPSIDSLSKAISFVQTLSESIPVPEPMLHSDGHAGLFWDTADLYSDLEFYADGRVTFFVRGKDGQTRGVVKFDGQTIPPVLLTLLSSPTDV